jgi:uncharacterized membrane protein
MDRTTRQEDAQQGVSRFLSKESIAVENFAVLMAVIAIFIVFVVGFIAAIVVAADAVTQRIERNSLKALTSRLSRGEISADEFSLLLADQVVSLLPHDTMLDANALDRS